MNKDSKKLTRAQQMMVDDGLPASLILSDEERAAAWKVSGVTPPLRNVSSVKTLDDDATVRLKSELNTRNKQKTAGRIAKLKAKKHPDQQYVPGMRWCSERCKFILDAPTKQEQKTMSEIEQQTNTQENSTMAQVPKKARVRKAKVAKAKKAKTVKAKTTVKAKKANGVKHNGNGVKKLTFLDITREMLERKSGVTSEELAEKLGWKSASIPSKAKALKMKIRKDKQPGKPARFYAV